MSFARMAMRLLADWADWHGMVRLAIGFCVGAAGLPGCGRGAPPADAGAKHQGVVITVANAETRGIQRKVHVVGSLAPIEKVTLSNRVTGTVEKLHADLGSVVKPGQILAEMIAGRCVDALPGRKRILARTGRRKVCDAA